MASIERIGVYDFPTQQSVKLDRGPLLAEVGVGEVVLLVEPLWGGAWAPYLTPEALCARTFKLRSRLGLSVTWAFRAKAAASWLRGVQRFLERVRQLSAQETFNLPSAMEWVPTGARFVGAPANNEHFDTLATVTRSMRRWATGRMDMPFSVATMLTTSRSLVSYREGGHSLVLDGRSGRGTVRAAGAAQRDACRDLEPGDVVCLAAAGQDAVAIEKPDGTVSRECRLEDVMTASLEAAVAAGARRVRYWCLQDLVGDDGQLTRAGVWIKSACKRYG